MQSVEEDNRLDPCQLETLFYEVGDLLEKKRRERRKNSYGNATSGGIRGTHPRLSELPLRPLLAVRGSELDRVRGERMTTCAERVWSLKHQPFCVCLMLTAPYHGWLDCVSVAAPSPSTSPYCPCRLRLRRTKRLATSVKTRQKHHWNLTRRRAAI